MLIRDFNNDGWAEAAASHGILFSGIIFFNKYKTIVEIGVATAGCTQYLCQAAMLTGGHVYGYDDWDVHGLWNQFNAFSSKEACEELLNQNFTNFTLYKVNTKSIEFHSLLNQHSLIDFAFIDGDHSYQGVQGDFELIYPKLASNGTIAFHDTKKIDGSREFMLDLRTKYYDGTYDIIDFPCGEYGISLLVKRHLYNTEWNINEVCGANPIEQIYDREKVWFNNQIQNI